MSKRTFTTYDGKGREEDQAKDREEALKFAWIWCLVPVATTWALAIIALLSHQCSPDSSNEDPKSLVPDTAPATPGEWN
jgi:hypothetical protein